MFSYKSLLRLFALTFLFTFQSFLVSEVAQPASYAILDDQLHPTAAFRELLITLEINPDQPFLSLLDETQKKWLRKPDQNRWEMSDPYSEKAAHLKDLLRKMGCIDEVSPTKQEYDYAIILGCTVNALRPKILQLIEAWERGVKFKKIIFLSSTFVLDPNREVPRFLNLSSLKGRAKKDWKEPEVFPETEYEYTKALVDQVQFPEGLDPSAFIYINTPMQPKAGGGLRIANTQDTIKEWLNTEHPEPGTCLVFSIQPHVGYQDSISRIALPDSFDVETIGKSGYENINCSVQLDNLTRWLYAEAIRRHLK